MSKIFDITDRLNYEEPPVLKVKNVELKVNDDAETMLRVMGKLGENITPKNIVEMYELLIPEQDRKKLAELKLNFDDFQKVVRAAINAATGQEMDLDDVKGEVE